MTENGGYNDKYTAIRDFISGIKDWPNPPKPLPPKPMTFAQSGVGLTKIGNWFDFETVTINSSLCVKGPLAKTFEELDQPMGFVKYSIVLNVGGSELDGSGIKDFGYVFGRVSPNYKPHEVSKLQLSLKRNDLLEIVVENQGRLTWETTNDFKGMVGPVMLDGAQLTGWTSCAVDVQRLVDVTAQSSVSSTFNVGDVFRGDFTATGKGDTFIDVSNWGKGVVWLNGFNLGRYWGSAGPQKYLYIPAPLITNGKNTLIFLELEQLSSECKGTQCTINLLDHPLLYK
ncbi:hypothetical protein COOONC_13369 [Cooperia oncophora]